MYYMGYFSIIWEMSLGINRNKSYMGALIKYYTRVLHDGYYLGDILK